jgi:REP element-mobilizing transposase RayT
MSNHVHAIIRAQEANLSDVIRDFKRYTATQILKLIEEENESRKDWMLKRFEFATKRHKRNSRYQFWTHENHAIELEPAMPAGRSLKFIMQKMAYIHDNPVRAGFVDHAEHWLYSSQRNYSGLSTLIDIDMIEL